MDMMQHAMERDTLVQRRMTGCNGVAVSTACHRIKVKMIAERKAELSLEEWGTVVPPTEMTTLEAAFAVAGE